jgi:transposase, IS30 family
LEREGICRLRASGLTLREVAEQSGRSKATVDRVLADAGGVPPRRAGRGPRALRFDERETISRGLVGDESFAQIARGLGRPTSAVSREVSNNGGPKRYRAVKAERRAYEQAARPKVARLARPANAELRREVEAGLDKKWSPEVIANRLRQDHPDRPEMWVSHETIYQSIYVQGRGALRKELHKSLRSGRARRRSRGAGGGDGRGQIRDMVNISERPAEVADRAVPGHWEGDLIIGKNNASAIGTLVERTTRFVLLLELPDGYSSGHVLAALLRQIATLPDQLVRSLTWDQGKEMALHADFTIATGIQVYFCDPHSPWQRGTNENTNGLLRQYFPKGTDLSVYSQAVLDAVARELNDRPRKTLDYMKPSEKFAELVALAA